MITALCLLLSAAMAVTPAPRDMLTAEMILIEVAQDGQQSPSGSQRDHGQCKRFQIDSFAEASKGYQLAAYPGVELFLPSEHAPVEESGRPVGTCWHMPGAAEGNAFEEVARFDLNRDLTQRENEALARAFLCQVRAGDVVQMLARYTSGGRGTHTILITQPYDARDAYLYWADSNFANTLVEGERYGIVRARQRWAFEEVVGWLVADWHNGATIYRTRDDVVRR